MTPLITVGQTTALGKIFAQGTAIGTTAPANVVAAVNQAAGSPARTTAAIYQTAQRILNPPISTPISLDRPSAMSGGIVAGGNYGSGGSSGVVDTGVPSVGGTSTIGGMSDYDQALLALNAFAGAYSQNQSNAAGIVYQGITGNLGGATETFINSLNRNISMPIDLAAVGNAVGSAATLVSGIAGSVSGTGKGLTGASVVGSGHGYLILQSTSGKRILVKRAKRSHFKSRGSGNSGMFNKMMQLAMVKAISK